MHESMNNWKKYTSLLGISLLKFIAYIPFGTMYIISDLMFIVVYHIIRYRRKVVFGNLLKSFPASNQKELRKIEREYYRYMCDLTLEALKTGTMSKDDLNRRMKIRNPEVVNQFFNEGKSVIVMAMHYGNWEWLLHMPLHIRHHNYFVYKPLHNNSFDNYLNGMRSRFGGETISMSLALRKIMESDKKNIPVMTWLAADQTPPWFHPFWTIFLNQEAQFFDGPAKIAQRFDQPIVFQQVRRVSRGHYETWFDVLIPEPGLVSEEQIILAYVDKVEQVIKNDPSLYLWSHRRWKHKRMDGIPLHPRG